MSQTPRNVERLPRTPHHYKQSTAAIEKEGQKVAGEEQDEPPLGLCGWEIPPFCGERSRPFLLGC